MKIVLLLAGMVISIPTVADATVMTYTSSTEFHAAEPDAVLIEDFEDSQPWSWSDHLPSYSGPRGLISFTPLDGVFEPNLCVGEPWYMTFAADLNPIASYVLTTNGNEDIVGTLANPSFALGFDLFLNDSPGTLTFFNGADIIATILYETPVVVGDNRAFGGVLSTDGVTGFRWTATNGQVIDTGIDNIFADGSSSLSSRLAVPSIPEPSTWAMMLTGFAMIGGALRRLRRSNSLTHVAR